MTYLDAVKIVEKEIDQHKILAERYERNGSIVDLLKSDDERILIDVLETILREGNRK